ncbi:Appr-1-p processing protein [Stenotrophomonas maltophilia]|nr:Appr-1-p processing protein [Stenotrophomonas maltophilia]
MTIKFEYGDLFTSGAEALVNTVNCVGVMGKGVALEFKKRWPENFKFYKKHCDDQSLRPGKVLIYDQGGMFVGEGPRFIVNFPTKDHWRSKSKMSYVDDGLDSLVEEIKRLSIKSVAMPPLGCGNGGLDWDEVRPLIVSKLSVLNDVSVELFGPSVREASSPEYKSKGVAMTEERAIFLRAVAALEPSFGGAIDRLSLQKIAYFIQVFGVQLNLSFEDSLYGPYSDSLKKSLFSMTRAGFISGYEGDGRFVSVTRLGFAAAEDYSHSGIGGAPVGDEVVAKLIHLLDGFCSPYGLELLATVHWHGAAASKTVDHNIADIVHSLGDYRRSSFPRKEIEAALIRAKEDGLLVDE